MWFKGTRSLFCFHLEPVAESERGREGERERGRGMGELEAKKSICQLEH